MYIDKRWRILTVGDGDLSFSHSLAEHHQITRLTASTLDSESRVRSIYSEAHLNYLLSERYPVFHGVDVTRPESIPSSIRHAADVVVFQFPLLPVTSDVQSYSDLAVSGDKNLAHRILLHSFLTNAERFLLARGGAGLCMVTSKDVKPYSDWNLVASVSQHTNMTFLGQRAFDVTSFPGYKVQNVSRDSKVKSTAATTYVWGRGPCEAIQRTLTAAPTPRNGYCDLCQAGPFMTKDDLIAHQRSRKHCRLVKYEHKWQKYLQTRGYSLLNEKLAMPN